jgi:acetyltransferase-like isoleucine patch superfamily enzyme
MGEPLHARLTALISEQRQEKGARWDRDLPLDELFSDRWERARRLGFGEGANIYGSAYVYGDVSVGEKTWIGPYTVLDGSGGLTIGEGCNISAGAQIYTHDTIQQVLTDGAAGIDRAPVSIGAFCHIGPQAVIAKGVTIGDHSVIGAHAFVNRDIPAYTVAVGVPCRPIGRVEVADGRATLVYDAR